ncbi:MAG: lytic transglycosylase domain-containing protein, partial [Lachnospiraceae bacterium]|nr:lytic transglycosylase domain-containing protein [Lachnospiraceae bacterium]
MPNMSVSSVDGTQFSTATIASKKENSGDSSIKFDTFLSESPVAKTSSVSGAANPTSLNDIFERASNKYGVDVNLLKALGYEESRFQANAVSSAGAIGIMQLMPETAKSLGVTNPYDPEQNIMGGAKLLAAHLKKYDGNVTLALAAYGAGSGAVDRYGGVPPYKDLQTAIKRVLNFYYNGLGADNSLAERIKLDGSTIASNVNKPNSVLTDISNPVPSYLTAADIKKMQRDIKLDKMLDTVADRDIYLTSNMETDMISEVSEAATDTDDLTGSTATVTKSDTGYTYEDYLDFVDDYVDIVANMSNRTSSTSRSSNGDSISSALSNLYTNNKSTDSSILNVLQSTLASMTKN